MSPTTRTMAVALGAAAICVVAGCSSAVEVSPAGRGAESVCREVAAAYPGTVGGGARRDVKGSPGAGGQAHADGVGAWGDPAIIARCGVSAVAPTEVTCVEVDGVGWIPSELSDGTRFTTFGTDPALEVLVPKAYAPEPMLLPAFTQAARALPGNGLACR